MKKHKWMYFLLVVVFALFAIFLRATANDAPTVPDNGSSTNASSSSGIDGYRVTAEPANIALTVASLPHTQVQVSGQPRTTNGHPCTLWDQEDIDHYKDMLKTSKELQFQLADMKARMDKVIAESINIPAPQKKADGSWAYPGDYFPPFPDFPHAAPADNFRHYITRDSAVVCNLGILYALTGDEKYGEYARQLLLAYAHASEYTAAPTTNYRNVSGISTSLLTEALVLDYFAFGYDLVYNLPSWKPEEHTQVHDEWLRPLAEEMVYPGSPELDNKNWPGRGLSFSSQANNRGLIGSTSVLWVGYATDDQELINAALLGIHPTSKKPDQAHLRTFPPPKDWTVATPDKPSQGLLTTFFAPDCISGGIWVEGSPTYAFYALGSMVDAAEMAWHHNLDLYRYNDCIMKYMFDFPILLSYPDMTTPGENDGHRESLLLCPYPSFLKMFGAPPNLYEYAYRRYRDPAYVPIINNSEERAYLSNPTPPPPPAVPGVKPPPPPPGTPPPIYSERHLDLTSVGVVPPSLLYDLDPAEAAIVPPAPSVNYPLVGFGILRTPAANGSGNQGLIMSYGPSASHGHPDKLHIDLYAMNDVLMPSPGINFPYAGNIRIPKWYHTTLAHNTLTVDEKSQDYLGANAKTTAHADQVVFGPASTVGLQRAWTDSVYPGVTMDRAVFMTPNYLADVFGAFSASPHKYDLAWHIRGDVTSDLTFKPITFDPNVNGYSWFTSARASDATDKPWAITSTGDAHVARLHVASGPPTQAIIGEGGIFADETSSDPTHKPTCPTIIERRENATSTIYGNALDFSDSKDGYVKDVSQEGGLDAGYGLLKVTTAKGTDLCFTSFRPGVYKADGLETDALQALVLMDGTTPETLYLGGGKTLAVGGASINRSEAGLAFIEKAADGGYVVGNPSPTDATITISLSALNGLTAYALDDNGQKGAVVAVTSSGAAITVPLSAGAKVLFANK